MQVKHLIKHGNSLALVIDKSVLKASNLNENSLFQIINSANGVTIQSVEPTDEKSFEETLKHVIKKYSKALTYLADK